VRHFRPTAASLAYTGGSYSSSVALVLPSQCGEQQLISNNTSLMDWTRDGRYLAVASPHSGATALQLIPVKNGKPAGDPVFVRYGSIAAGFTTASGALLYSSFPAAGTPAAEWIADLDPNGRPGSWTRLNLSSSGYLWPVPTWSPDSSEIVWAVESKDTGQAGFVVRLRSVATGKERDLYRGAGLPNCIWAARHPNFVLFGDCRRWSHYEYLLHCSRYRTNRAAWHRSGEGVSTLRGSSE
jgi:hypothetical protein